MYSQIHTKRLLPENSLLLLRWLSKVESEREVERGTNEIFYSAPLFTVNSGPLNFLLWAILKDISNLSINPGLFEPRFFKHELFNHKLFNPIFFNLLVQKWIVEEFMIEKSWVEMSSKRAFLTCCCIISCRF